MGLFFPNLLKENITKITIEDLNRLDVKGVFLDVDNTLTTHSSQFLDPKVSLWLAHMKKAGFKLTVVSNAFNKRVAPFAEKIGLEHIAFSCKPSPFGFWRAAKKLNLPLKRCVIIGDQIFTDILGAKLAGVKSILVLPIELEKSKPTLRFKRMLERKILKSYRRKHGISHTD